MKRLYRVSLIAVALLIGVIGVSAVSAQEATQVPVSTNTTMTNTITVTGIGTASGEPDVAYVELGVETVNADLSTAFEEANTTMTTVIQALTDSGIDRLDIQTTFLNVYQEDIYDPQSGTPTGERTYHVQNFVRATVRDTATIGSVVSTAVEAGANRINGLSFGILDTAALESTARTAAVENARARATELAAALGLQVGDPISVREVYGSSSPIALGGGFDRAQMAAATVSTGSLQVSVQIEVTFALISQ